MNRRRFFPALAAPFAFRPSRLRAADAPLRYRREPAFEALRDKIAPGSDEFPSEQTAMEIEQALRQREAGRYFVLPGGRARFERSGRDQQGLWYRTGLLKVEWRDGRLGAIETMEETTARARQPLFTDVTGQLFGGIESFREQLTRGVPYWRSRLDAAAGVTVYGQQGIAAGDIDNDGQDEIYICQPGGLPNRLYKFEAGKWIDWTERAGAGILDDTPQALFLDTRNTGYQDLIVLTAGRIELFLNDGSGRFRRAPDAFRFATPPQGTFAGMAAADFDRDGRLDLYVCSYLYFQSEEQYRYPAPYHDAQNGPPNFLFRNRLNADGSGFFEDVTAAAGLAANNNRFSFAAAWCDFDDGGWPSLYVANDFGRNNLYRNRGGKFEDVADETGVEDMAPGMSAAWFDSNQNGRPDLYVSNMWTPSGQRVAADPAFGPLKDGATARDYAGHVRGNSLYRNRDGRFENVAEAEGASMGRWAWSADGFDWDLDGVPEILTACGMLTNSREDDLMSFFWRQVVAKSPGTLHASPDYEAGWNAINQFIREDYSWNGREPNVFLKRIGDRYTDYSGVSGLDVAADSRAFAVVDLDGDGVPDVVLKNRLGPQIQAFRNDCAQGRTPLVIELVGTKSNRDAIGAKVELLGQAKPVVRWVAAGSGYISQHTKRIYFASGGPATVRVTWPSGAVEEFRGLAPGRRHRCTEGGARQEFPLVKRSASGPSPVKGDNRDVFEPTRLLNPVPLPETPIRSGAHTLVLDDLKGDRLAIYTLFRRYLFEYRGPLRLPLTLRVDDRGFVTEIHPGNSTGPLPAAIPFAGVWLSPPARSFFRLAMPFLAAGYPEAGLPYLRLAAQQEPTNFKVQLAAGEAALEAGRLDEAERYLNSARTLGESPELWNNLGGLALEQGRANEALALFEKTLAANPRSVYAWVNAGQAAAKLGDGDKAERCFRQALEIDPNDADAANQLGLLLAKRGLSSDAQKLFERAIETRRNFAAAINNLAILFASTGRPSEAIAALRYGIETAPDYDLIWINLAKVYADTRDFDRARFTLEEFLERRPGHPEATKMLAQLRSR
jgi:tetratricopeptide (TPR) repeat protein